VIAESKPSYNTTELIAIFVAVIEAWFYVCLLTIGYMASRGLAKSGAREPHGDDGR